MLLYGVSCTGSVLQSSLKQNSQWKTVLVWPWKALNTRVEQLFTRAMYLPKEIEHVVLWLIMNYRKNERKKDTKLGNKLLINHLASKEDIFKRKAQLYPLFAIIFISTSHHFHHFIVENKTILSFSFLHMWQGWLKGCMQSILILYEKSRVSYVSKLTRGSFLVFLWMCSEYCRNSQMLVKCSDTSIQKQ